MNIHPLASDEECMEAFGNIEGRTIERIYNNYINSNGDQQYRHVNIGVWTVDLKELLVKLTGDLDNTDMHRFVLRGTVFERERPKNTRFGGGSITAPLTKRDMKGF